MAAIETPFDPFAAAHHYDVAAYAFVPAEVIPVPQDDFVPEIVEPETVEEKARRLHAEVYLQEGYVSTEDVTAEGVLAETVDPYVERSEYFWAEAGGREVTARQITAGSEGLLSFPTLEKFSCDPDVLKQVAGVENLTDIGKGEVVEISGLAASDGVPSDNGNLGPVIDVYVKMLRHSVEEGHKLWVMGTDRRLTRKLTGLLGNDLIHRLGERREFMGSPTDPMVLNPQTVVKEFLTSEDPAREPYKEVIAKSFNGIDVTTVDPEMRQVLEDAGVETVESSKFKAMWEKRKPEAIAFASLVGYTALRAAPVGQIDQFHGDPWIFFGIDAGTALPYTAGMSWMLRAKNSVMRKFTGAAVASTSFAAPYAYLWANGENYPGYVNAAIGGFITFGVAKEGISRRLRGRKEKRLTEGLVAEAV